MLDVLERLGHAFGDCVLLTVKSCGTGLSPARVLARERPGTDRSVCATLQVAATFHRF